MRGPCGGGGRWCQRGGVTRVEAQGGGARAEKEAGSVHSGRWTERSLPRMVGEDTDGKRLERLFQGCSTGPVDPGPFRTDPIHYYPFRGIPAFDRVPIYIFG
jgi:hypothetical protein